MIRVKLVIVGSPECGKTSLLLALQLEKEIDDNHLQLEKETHQGMHAHAPSTYGVEENSDYMITQNLMVDNTPFMANILETNGSEEYDRLRPLHYPHTDCFMVCVDMASDSSRSMCTKFVTEIERYSPNANIVVVGTKSDLPNREPASSLLANGGLLGLVSSNACVECSARLNEGVREAFEAALRLPAAALRLPAAAGKTKMMAPVSGKMGFALFCCCPCLAAGGLCYAICVGCGMCVHACTARGAKCCSSQTAETKAADTQTTACATRSAAEVRQDGLALVTTEPMQTMMMHGTSGKRDFARLNTAVISASTAVESGVNCATKRRVCAMLLTQAEVRRILQQCDDLRFTTELQSLYSLRDEPAYLMQVTESMYRAVVRNHMRERVRRTSDGKAPSAVPVAATAVTKSVAASVSAFWAASVADEAEAGTEDVRVDADGGEGEGVDADGGGGEGTVCADLVEAALLQVFSARAIYQHDDEMVAFMRTLVHVRLDLTGDCELEVGCLLSPTAMATEIHLLQPAKPVKRPRGSCECESGESILTGNEGGGGRDEDEDEEGKEGEKKDEGGCSSSGVPSPSTLGAQIDAAWQEEGKLLVVLAGSGS
jgi:small GTP-binding protein